MLNYSKFSLIAIILVVITSFLISFQSFFGSENIFAKITPDNKINLGLDLKGGSYMTLETDTSVYFKESLESLKDDVSDKLSTGKIPFQNAKIENDTVSFEINSLEKEDDIRAVLRDYKFEYDIVINNKILTLSFKSEVKAKLTRDLLSKAIEILRKRIDELGTREPIIQQQGSNRILVQVPGLKDTKEMRAILGKTARLTFHLMHPTSPFPQRFVKAPDGYLLAGGNDEGGGQLYLIAKKPLITGDMLIQAGSSFSQGMPVIQFTLNTQGGKAFSEVTKENVGKPFAIVLDGQVISAPVIQSHIAGGSGIITGNFTPKSAEDLAILLRSGSLPVPLKIVEEKIVGPGLGEDSIKSGKLAGIIGFVAVVVFMIIFYGLFGVFASIALFTNLFILFAVMILLGSTLTLPGIAGIVLTMGMAVDTNILIFERIREEIRGGKTPYSAIENGFKGAFVSICDSNLTTLIATFLLFTFGVGLIKGFAVTLSLGIMTSMFTAITVTRLMIVIWLKKTKPKTVPI